MEISTFHIERSECQIELSTPFIRETQFEASVSLFQEIECLKSDSPASHQEKCFIISGFRVAERDSYPYFTRNWREVSGLGNILTYLASKYYVNSVIFLANNSFPVKSDTFHFMIIVEVSFRSCQLIDLLDFVQKFRVERNVGFISVYGELKHNSDGETENFDFKD